MAGSHLLAAPDVLDMPVRLCRAPAGLIAAAS